MTTAVNNVPGKLIVLAANVHQGGGRTLLEAILAAPLRQGTTIFIDERMPLPQDSGPGITAVRVRPSIAGRLRGERSLAAMAERHDTILCFGNLPPLFTASGRVVVFVQNRLLIDGIRLNGFAIATKARLILERLWFRMRVRTVDEFVVQTPSMKNTLERYLSKTGRKPGCSVRVMPFAREKAGSRGAPAERRRGGTRYDFIYVSSGDAHKNHRSLIEAWALLAQTGHFPSLALTVDAAAFPELSGWIENLKRRYNLRIENRGVVPYPQISELYECSGALIFPSTLESFGLPLVEARNAGLPVLAAELDYVRDILDPEQTFDPGSATSIARAVRRFMGIEEPPLTVVDARAFVESLTPNQS